MSARRTLFSVAAVFVVTSFAGAPTDVGPWSSVSEPTLRAQRPFGEARPTVDLSMEQRHVIKELVKDLPSAEQNAERVVQDANLSIGATVPPTVKLQPFSADIVKKVPAVRAHSFFIKDNQIFVVDVEKKIAEIIE